MLNFKKLATIVSNYSILYFQILNASIVFCSGNILQEIIGEFVPMEMVLLDVETRKSFEHVLTSQSAKELHRQFQPLNHRLKPNLILTSGLQMSTRTIMRSIMTTKRLYQTITKMYKNHRQTFLEPSSQCSRFFSSYVHLLQSMFTTIMAMF